jgi:hypothetical protein
MVLVVMRRLPLLRTSTYARSHEVQPGRPVLATSTTIFFFEIAPIGTNMSSFDDD